MSMQSNHHTTSVGVIGAGGMGGRHARNLHRLVGGARVAGIYDLDQQRARQMAEACGGAAVFTDPGDLINEASVAAVLIASPDGTHAELTLACLRAGKPVLTEKPLATTLDDAVRVLEAEAAVGRRLVSLGFMRRFDPQHAAVKTAAASGTLGRPLLFKGVHRNAAVAFGITGETILINSAGHDIDSARWLLGEEVTEVSVRGLRSRAELHADTQDLLLIEMALTNNSLATVEVFGNAGYGYEVSAELVCQCGTAVTTQADAALVRGSAHRGYPVPADWLSRFQEAYVAELLEWIDSLQTGRAFGGANTWDGYMTMLITGACIESLRRGTVVPVKPLEKPALYG